jgi:sec-independent protein translocase protein TatA
LSLFKFILVQSRTVSGETGKEFDMPNLGTTELIIILVIVILIFGVGKLPEVGKGMGQSIHDFRAAVVEDVEAEAKAKED